MQIDHVLNCGHAFTCKRDPPLWVEEQLQKKANLFADIGDQPLHILGVVQVHSEVQA